MDTLSPKSAKLYRISSDSQGTFGLLKSEGFSVFISELPFKDNLPSISCIPAGIYAVGWHRSPKFGWCYKLFNVKGRNEILIHKGNYVGDSSKGFKTHSHGCLLPALRLGTLGGQKAGLLSKPATDKLYSYFNKEPFTLEIINAYDNSRTPI